MSSDDLIDRHVSDHYGRITRHHDSIRHVARDDGTGSDQGILADRYPPDTGYCHRQSGRLARHEVLDA